MSSYFVIVCLCLSFINISLGQRPCCEEYCYDTDTEKPQAAQFSAKAAYQIIKGSQNNNNGQYIVPNCSPQKIWMLARHGTRLPSAKDIKELRNLGSFRDEIIRNYEERRTKPDDGAMCDEDLELLKNWNWLPNATEQYEYFLTTQGWDDMKGLAIHYQTIFPQILENIYSKEKFLFHYTPTQRTEASFKAFIEGLFGDHAYDHIKLPQQPDLNMLLRPYDICPIWKEHRNQRNSPNSEHKKFEETEQFQRIISDISIRLGFKFSLKIDQIKLMWDMCRYDQAWSLDRPSAWCTVFTKSQVKLLEYYEDLKYYYESGYGHQVNERLACTAVRDMLRHLESKALPKVITYFAHASTVQLLLTAMGAGRDQQPLRADNYEQMMRRNYRSSELSPFASNLAAVKYDCPNDMERNKVIFFLNEKPLSLPWCKVGLCNWSEVKRKYSFFEGSDCAATFCIGGSGAANLSSATSLLFATILVAGIINRLL